MIRKIICGVINTLSVLVIAAAIVILCMVLFTEPGKPPNIFGFTMLRITTGSMEPTYATDTLLVVKKTDPKKIMEGDVISFYSTDPALEGAVNTHRVVSISQDGDSYIYTTKGDANNAADLYDAQSRYLIGKVIWSSLFLGKLSRLAANQKRLQKRKRRQRSKKRSRHFGQNENKRSEPYSLHIVLNITAKSEGEWFSRAGHLEQVFQSNV